jgi:hypothetical protein
VEEENLFYELGSELPVSLSPMLASIRLKRKIKSFNERNWIMTAMILSPEFWNTLCPTEPVFRCLSQELGNQLHFKCHLDQHMF